MSLTKATLALEKGKKLAFSAPVAFSAPAEYEEKALKALRLFIPEIGFETAGSAVIRCSEDQATGAEAYRLCISDGGVDIAFSDHAGLKNALAFISLAATVKAGSLILPECRIEDSPAAAYRGVMLDLGRGVADFEELKEHAVMISRAGFNVLHLHLCDSEGVGFEAESLPESMRHRGAYTKAQLRELVELADVLGLRVLPEFDMPAHAGALLKARPDLACRVEGRDPATLSKWTVCPAKEEVYRVFDGVMEEIAGIFPDEYFHMGGDELDFADAPQIDQLCHWSECADCRALMEKEGLKDRQDLYYHFTRRIRELCRKRGKKLMMWSDQIDCARPAGIPDDVLMQFWRVAGKGRGPVEGCSLNAQLKMGYTAVNSYYPNTYVDIENYINPEKLASWHWRSVPEVEKGLASQIIGSELCAWEYGNRRDYPHYSRTVPAAVFLFGDKLFEGGTPDYTPAYRRTLTRAILSRSVPEDLDVFEAIGDVLPPRKKDQTFYPEKLSVSRERLEYIKSELEKLEGYTARAYLESAIDAEKYLEENHD